MDVGCYCVSGIRLLGGEPERVHAEAVAGPSGVDLRLAGTLRLPGDVLGQFDCAFTTPHRDELEAIGTEGTLFLDDPGTAGARASSSGAPAAWSGSRSRPPTPTGSSSRTSRTPSATAAGRVSAATTPSGRPERSRRSTARPRAGSRLDPRSAASAG